jgi:hypothetical protein
MRLHALWSLALAVPTLADVYTLADGDRISGKTLGLEAGIYKVQTAYGRLAIPRGKVLKIVHDDGREEVLDAAAVAAAAPVPAAAPGPQLVLVVSGASFWHAWLPPKEGAFDPTLRFDVSLDEEVVASYTDAKPDPEISGAVVNAFGFGPESVNPSGAEGVRVAAPETRPGRITLRIDLPAGRGGERKLRVAYFGRDATTGTVRELVANSIYVELKPETPSFVRVKQDAGRLEFSGFPKKKMKGLETFRIEMGME